MLQLLASVSYHSYATHALQSGAFVRDLQVVLGHNSLETTMLYQHTEAGRVTSPLSDSKRELVTLGSVARRLFLVELPGELTSESPG